MKFLKGLGAFTKKNHAAKGFQPKKTPQRLSQQTFILEPLITPSGLVDSIDHAPHPLAVDLHVPPMPEGHLPGLDSVDIPDPNHIVAHASEPVSHPGDNNPDSGLHSDLVPPSNTAEPYTGQADILASHTVETPVADHQLDPLPFIHTPSTVESHTEISSELATTTAHLPRTFNSGVFTVDNAGKVSIDYLFDGGQYQGELAIFNLDGMEHFQPGSQEFIQEAATRALSDSNLGHVVINDTTEGARFHGSLAWESDFNSGEYQGVRTYSMQAGSQFGVMLVPNGTVQQVFEHPEWDGAVRPLFSLATANPNDAFHVAQIADVSGAGHTFVMEDLRVDGFSDHDYNDIIFQVRGATGTATHLDNVIDPSHDWRTTDMGKALIAYAKPYDHPPVDVHHVDAPPTVTHDCQPTDHIVPPPVDTSGTLTPIADTQGVHFHFPRAQQPLIGVIDTGFSANNPDIDLSHVTLGHDYVAGDANPLLQPGEGNDHGTHVLGVIAATNDNGIGIDGINDQAPIWVGRATDSGHWADSLVEFVNHAQESGQPNAVINLSMDLTQINPNGSMTTRYEFTPQERAAIEYARQHDVLIVVAAGNDGGVMSALGQASQEFDNIITVGAADGADRADYSSFGHGLDILAPGGTIDHPVLSTVGDGVGTMAGTSVATAQVTGAASQVWAANPDLSYRQVIDILQRTATDLKTPNWDLDTGAGLLNIAAAVQLAKVTRPIDVDVPIRFNFAKADQPLVGVIDTGFNGKNPDIDYSRVTLGRDLVDNDTNPLLEDGKGSEHGTHVLGIIAAIQGNGIGIDGMNDDAPLWLGRAIGSGKWAESLREFVDAAKASGQPNAVVNLSFDLTQTNPDGSVTTRYELTPQEREALEYARQNGVMIVVAAGNDGGTMSALGQASQEFDNIITIGSINNNGDHASYSSFGYGLDFVARGGTPDEQVISTVGEGVALNLLTSEEEPPEDEMSANAKIAFEEVFGSFSNAEDSEIDDQELENLTPEERQVYEEATREIDLLLNDYLSAASQKIALEYVDGYYAASVDALSRFVDAFDGDLGDNLIKAQEILQEAGFNTNTPTEGNLDFSIPIDLGIGEMAGTSVAAAKVTGAVSQVWAANPGLSYPQVKEILKQTAVDLNTPGWDLETGSGLVNVAAAVELAKLTQPQAYQPTPIQSPLTWSGEGKVTPGERAVNVSVPTFTGRLLNAGYVTQTGWLRIRSGPGTNYAEVGRKYPGDAIDFDAYENNGGWVPDPYMPGGGSSRWYKIAGSNNWMSALYIDNTPEQAEQERQRQEAIRRAEEEARRAEEELRRAEEEARRAEEELRRAEEEARRQAEEELRRILEEQRRRQEQLQAAVSQISQKVGDLGAQLGGYLSNGLAVYQFAKGTLLIQPDGKSAFYENVYKPVNETWSKLNSGNFIRKEFTNIPAPNTLINSFVNSNIVDPIGFWKTLEVIYPATKFLPPDLVLSGAASTREFFVNGKGQKITKGLNYVGDLLNYPLIKRLGSNTPVVGDVIDLGFLATDLTIGDEKTKRRAKLKIGAMGFAGAVGFGVGAVGFGVGAVPVSMGATLAASALLDVAYLAFDITGNGEVLDNAIANSFNAVGSGFNAVSSFTSSALEAAKEKAKAAADKARELADKAKAAYQTATATVQQAKASYQTFKTEVQKVTTQIVQQSQQKIKEEAQKIYNNIVQNPIVQAGSKVVNYVASYAKKAVQAVGNIINGAKQFVSNIIDTGKQIVNNVIETGKKAYEEVKNFVVNTYETGKKVVTETYNKAVEAVNNVTNTISNGFNSVKSLFSFGW